MKSLYTIATPYNQLLINTFHLFPVPTIDKQIISLFQSIVQDHDNPVTMIEGKLHLLYAAV